MNKDGLLKNIAATGYNVGFGAKKHFATYDIVEKMPGLIGFISTAFGVYALAFDALSHKFLSATFVVLGIIALYISFYDARKSSYEQAGVKLTTLYNRLRDLYRQVQSTSESDLSAYVEKLSELEGAYYAACISKQILFSDWYAHYKFFWQHQIDWVNEQKNFGLLRDKVPLSFAVFVAVAFVGVVAVLLRNIEYSCIRGLW
ncbi:SLATT domain-containing protein [Cupriavidus alkaliphilus]|uniref:SLATT domain-containing protein n=1 Tax=Cupriavidus alkaliphilus TaxID=942866 RepID=UPI001617CFCF|nr:SLATT domain-containing protein [Cupriavidus alkaliphilus]MBB2915705.1 hypothetical protein [Cupriavidus alkaliphilus]